MGSSKILPPPHQAGVYKDDPDRDDAASTSSAMLLGDFDSYPEEELPAYTDLPESSSSPKPVPVPRPNGGLVWYEPPTELPFSTKDMDCTEVRTHFPDYSHHTETLLSMLHEQASFPPTYFVRLTGTHTETTRRGNNKEEKSTVTDFVIQINITHLLQPGPRQGGRLEILPDNKRGYRGGILPSLHPSAYEGDIEAHPDELRTWCERYVHNPASVKSFILKRSIINHDTKKLDQLLRSAISATNYRGHLHIDFPQQHKKVIVYSPGLINRWRTTTWIRWVFYLTFLWVISWPVLFIMTRKYEVVKVVYEYADRPEDDGGERQCTVMSEVEWFHRWESAVRRAAIARMVCKDRCLDEEYRAATARADERGRVQPREQINTGNAVADGALSFLGAGLRVAEEWNAQRGWGGDD